MIREVVRIVSNFLTIRNRSQERTNLVFEMSCLIMSSKIFFAVESFGAEQTSESTERLLL